MPLSAWPWVLGAGAALASGIFGLRLERGRCEAQARRPARIELIGLILALLAAAVGLGWRAWDVAWPGASPADMFALLAAGGLIVAGRQIWSSRSREQPTRPAIALDLTLIGGAALLGLAAALAAALPASAVTPSAQPWLLGLRNILAGIGLGGWAPALAASLCWYLRTLGKPTAAAAPERSQTARPAEDPGRDAALFSFPWLTAACLMSAAWGMINRASVDPTAAADLWLLAAWLLGGAYLNITSSWRPLRVPGWLSPLLAVGTLAAGVLAASVAGSLR